MERWSQGFLLAASVLMVLALSAIVFYAPIEREQGLVQKIFYFHVPSAWVAFLAFFVVFVASIGYLWKKDSHWDLLAYCSAEVGVVFCTLVLATGPLWGKAVWGAWWTWDPRLTLTLVLWLIYAAYLVLRAGVTSDEKSADLGAVLGIVGFADVPLIHLSIRWWRGMHPGPIVGLGRGGDSSLHPAIFRTLLLSLAAFTVLYLALLCLRIPITRTERELHGIRSLQGINSY